MFECIKEHHPRLIEDIETLVADFYEQHAAHMSLDGETSRLLGTLRETGVPWGIVTSGSPNQLVKVRGLGLGALTPCVVVSAIVGIRKPAPEIFQTAAANLAIESGDILFVGDNPEADIIGAAGVGMQTVWMRRRRDWPIHQRASLPDHMIDSLQVLSRLLGTSSRGSP